MFQAKEGVKGHYWFMEVDMKNANILRPDKTGKSLLTVLRHLGRLHEVNVITRCHHILAIAETLSVATTRALLTSLQLCKCLLTV